MTVAHRARARRGEGSAQSREERLREVFALEPLFGHWPQAAIGACKAGLSADFTVFAEKVAKGPLGEKRAARAFEFPLENF